MQTLSPNRREPATLDVRIEIDLRALTKFWVWVDLAQGEVSALGLVDEVFDEKTGRLYALRVTDFFLVKQYCSSAETTMEPMAIAELLSSLVERGAEVGKLLCWAHSHADMSVFWSGQDNTCIAGLANGRYLFSLVVNKKRQTMARLDMFHPAHLCVTDLIWEPYFPLDESEIASAEEEFRAKVTEQHVIFPEKPELSAEQYFEQLKTAHEGGLLSDEELEDEISWLNQEGSNDN